MRVGLGHRDRLRDLLEPGVRVRVAVDVAQLDEAPEPLRLTDRRDRAVLDRDHPRAGAGEDVDPAAGGLGLDRPRHVLRRVLAAPQGALGEVVGVARLGVDREVALREAVQRADEIAGQAADQPRAHEHRLDVPVGVVVGEDRLAQVLVGAGGAQVARGGEDRVDRVERVLAPVAVGVGAVLLPGRRHELHPAQRAGRGDVEVAPVVGLDLVDRREHLPAHAVLDAGRLVDRQQERRDAELVDEEIRHADRDGAGQRERHRGVVGRGDPAGVAQRGGVFAGVALVVAVAVARRSSSRVR